MTADFTPSADPTKVEALRICAWTIDLLIFLALVFGVLLATGGFDVETKEFDSTKAAVDYCNDLDTSDGRTGCIPVDTDASIIHVQGSADGVWLFNFVVYVLIQGVSGGSIGKLIMGLRVVDEDGRLAGVRKSFVRTAMWIVDACTCGIPLVGGIAMVSSPGHQRIGDRVAKTYVVRKRSVGSPIVLPEPAIPYGHAIPPGYHPPGGYGPPPGVDPSAVWRPPPPGWLPEPTAPPAPTDGAPPPPPPYPHPYPYPSDAPGYPPVPPPYLPGPSRPSVVPPQTDGPHWDDDRDTYIQYDRAVEAWVQWDPDAKIWRPIET